jgi:hypothetical protein
MSETSTLVNVPTRGGHAAVSAEEIEDEAEMLRLILELEQY